MLDKLGSYKEAFLDFRGQREPSYELYSSIVTTDLALSNLSGELVEIFKENQEIIKSTPYFLVTEKDCKKFLLDNLPKLEKTIENFLRISLPLAKENQKFLDRIALFPFSKEAIIVLKESGIKIINKDLGTDTSGVYNHLEHVIYLSTKIEGENKERTLFHEACHAFYQLPSLQNIFIEESIERIVFDYLNNIKRDLELLK